jgi:hypothetical protein
LFYQGTLNSNNFKSNYRNRKTKLNNMHSKLNIKLRNTNTLKLSTGYFFILPNWDLTLLIPKNINKNFRILFFYSNNYYFKITIPLKFLSPKFDKQTRVFTYSTGLSYNHFQIYVSFLKNLFQVFYKPVFLKLKFKGKGYYIFKNKRNTITPQFGFSHRIYIYSYSLLVKFLTKTTIFLFGLSKQDILKVGYSVKNSRPINIFTGRGVRFSKQLIYKKTGKVSSYR